MIKQAFERGFIKAAINKGVHPLQAVYLLKQAFNWDNAMVPAIVGGGIGAGAGALLAPEKRKGQGALAGGLAGLAGGGYLGGAGHLEEAKEYLNNLFSGDAKSTQHQHPQ
jgi:hypothetical protein